MTPSKNGEPIAFYLSLAAACWYLGSRLVGVYPFDNNWSFNHWQFISGIYLVLWLVAIVVLTILLFRYRRVLSGLLESRRNRLMVTISLMILFFLFQFDSFLYGGGNHLMAQIAQSGGAVYRWYEFASAALVTTLFRLLNGFGMDATRAGYVGLKIYSLMGTLLTLWAAVLLSRRMTADAPSRVMLFAVMFFGPQSLIYFGYVGFEPFLSAVLYWYAVSAWELADRYTGKRLLAVWGLTIAGVVVHATMLILLPPTLLLTLNRKDRTAKTVSWVGGLVVLATLVAAAYLVASRNLEVARVILFPHSGNLQSSYNLFSPRHIGDMVQLLMLLFPQVIVLIYLFVRSWRGITRHLFAAAMTLTVLGDASVVMVSEPLHSVVLDTPHLAVFLAPLALLLGALLVTSDRGTVMNGRLLAILTVLAIAVPTGILPAYTSIKTADGYVESYLVKNPDYYMEGGIAFRDAYFFTRDFDRANQWEWKLPTSSEDFMQLKAAKEYLAAEQFPQAITLLYQIITKTPYHTEPRRLLAGVQMKLKQFNPAKAQIDTCLMLKPYERELLMLRYGYYRDMGDFATAQKEALKASEIFPRNNEIKSDLAIYYYRTGNMTSADSLASWLIDADPSLPFPYLIRGFIAESRQNPAAAIKYFEKFIALAPDEPETPQIRKRLNGLVLRQQPNP